MGFKRKSKAREENILIVEFYDGGVERVNDA
jgi:hypothetical protein